MKASGENKRKRYLDIAKGIGIILVVWAHVDGPGSRYINLFHMPMFFLISGLLFNEKSSCESFIIRKFKSLYIPFLSWNILIYFIEFLLRTNLESKEFQLDAYLSVVFQIEAGVNKSTFLGATWFLASLFWVSVIYKCLYSLLKKYIAHVAVYMAIISFIFAIIAFRITIPYFISRTVICSFFYSCGFLLKPLLEKMSNIVWKNFFSIVLLVVFFLINRNNFANMGQNLYVNRLFFLVGAFLASISVIILSNEIDNKLEQLGGCLAFLGINSMEIVIWQFVAFIPVFLLQGMLDHVGVKDCIGLLLSQHTYNTNSFWWFLYLICGLCIPLLLKHLLKNSSILKGLKKVYMVR